MRLSNTVAIMQDLQTQEGEITMEIDLYKECISEIEELRLQDDDAAGPPPPPPPAGGLPGSRGGAMYQQMAGPMGKCRVAPSRSSRRATPIRISPR